jgi:hypothetical protein
MKHRSIWNKLTKKELVHVIENCLVNDPLQSLIETRAAQEEMGKETSAEPCWECKRIAKKLGLE